MIPILLLAASAAHAADWPQFRGPNASGVSADKGLPVEFGPTKNVVWKTPLPPGHSSPILQGKQIFVTANEGPKLLTISLDRKTGRELWRREAPRPRVEENQKTNSFASPSPATDGKFVFSFFGDFGLIAYDFDGGEKWRVPLGPFNNINGHGSSPIVADGIVLLVCDQDSDSYLLAVDAATGKERWRTPRPEVIRGYTTPGIYRPKSGPTEVIVPGSFVNVSYNLHTGEKLWWVTGMAWQLKSAAVVNNGIIYISGWESGGDTPHSTDLPDWPTALARADANKDGRLSEAETTEPFRLKTRGYFEADLNKDGSLDENEWRYLIARRTSTNSVVAIRPGGRGDVTDTHVLFRYRKSVPNIPTPLIYNNVMFLAKEGGIFTSVDLKSGEILKQARLTGALDQYWASPVGADGKVYTINQACKVSVIKAEAQWEILAVNDLDDECFATPAIANGRLYIRTRTGLYAFATPAK